MKLVNGMPMSDGDQDNIIDLLTVTDRENEFWGKVGKTFKDVMDSVDVNDTLEEELDVEAVHSQFEEPKVFNKIGEDDDKDNIIHEYVEPVVEEKPDPQQSLFDVPEEKVEEKVEETAPPVENEVAQKVEEFDEEHAYNEVLNNMVKMVEEDEDTEKTNGDLHREISELRGEIAEIKATNEKNTQLLTQVRDIFGELLLELKI